MTCLLDSELKTRLALSLCDSEGAYQRILGRIEQGGLTREENTASHFSTYFLPYDSRSGRVFLVHHKKSGLWLSPGGHIEPGETLIDTLNRETAEELGLHSQFDDSATPFMFSITEIENPRQRCRTHFDVWYLLPTDGKSICADTMEFHTARWMAFDEARRLVTEPHNLRALSIIEPR